MNAMSKTGLVLADVTPSCDAMEPTPFESETTALTPVCPPEPTSRSRATLLVVEGPEPGRLLALALDRTVCLGRAPNADVCIDEASVSRIHARIRPREDGCVEDGCVIEDAGSTNGTYVAHRRIGPGGHPLSPGDRVRLGGRVVLRFDRHDTREQEMLLRLYDSAVRDPLTGLHNRGYLEERLEAEVSYALRHETDLALLLLDVDHFKDINDEHGHLAGDAVLRVLSTLVQRMVRPEDVLARYGGEEIVVAARGLDAQGAGILADRLRRSIEALDLSWKGSPIRITVSVGVATRKRDWSSTEALLAAADEALYAAKRAGRNRSALAGDVPLHD